MSKRVNAVMLLSLAAAMPATAVTGGNLAIAPADPHATGSQLVTRAEVLRVVSSITGNTIIVDWHGTWDYATIQEGLDASVDGDTIIVLPSVGSPDGAYVENILFPARAIMLRSINPADPEIVSETVIDGNANGSVVAFAAGATTDAVLDGFTIRNGDADYGGGIHCAASSPTIMNCVIDENMARSDGGGVYCSSGAPTIRDCTISGNHSRNGGGGLYCDSSAPTVMNCAFDDNFARYTGGGICNWWQSSPILVDCTFTSNQSNSEGGAMYESYQCSSVLINCVFSGNTAGDAGGAISSYSQSNSVLTSCIFRANYADYGGAMCNQGESNPTLTNCLFSANAATGVG